MTLNYTVTSLLIQNNPAAIHILLDIPYELAMDACKAFKGIMDNFSEQVVFFPEREKSLYTELKKVRLQHVAALIYLGQKHDGGSEISLDEVVGT